jgi:hypothetical protein
VTLKLISICLGFGGGEESLQGFNARAREAARGGELQLRGQLLYIPTQDSQRIGVPDKPCVPAHLADGAKDGDGPELFQDVCIAQ